MLVEFSVENFLSFKNKATLSMVASSDRALQGNIFSTGSPTKERLLKSAAIYGANASGKSNFIRAIKFMDWLVTKSFESISVKDSIPVTPFLLDENGSEQPSTFEIIFLYKKVRYLYGFSINQNSVLEEWFYSYPKKQPRLLFERHLDKKTKRSKYKFGSSWKGSKATLTDLVRHNTLLVSVGSQANLDIPLIVTQWFSDKLRSVSSLPVNRSEEEYTKRLVLNDEKAKKEIINFLNNADININNIIVEKVPVLQAKSLQGIPEEERKEILNIVMTRIDSDVAPPSGELTVLDARLSHLINSKKDEAREVLFDLANESDGTQKLFAIAGPILHVLKKGCCLVVDELDVKLHPLLSRAIVKIFNDKQTNPRGAQLIFATHDSSLMDIKSLFRRDQIWFTVRNAGGESSLYSLWDFKKPPRKEENIINGYLAGRYGAIPILDGLIR